MDKEKILKELYSQNESIKAHINRLKKNNYDIHILDVDMLKKKTIELYDMVFALDSLVSQKLPSFQNEIHVPKPPVVETLESKEPIEIKQDTSIDEPTLEDSKSEFVENKPEVPEEGVIDDVVVEEVVIDDSVKVVIAPPIEEPEATVSPKSLFKDETKVESNPDVVSEKDSKIEAEEVKSVVSKSEHPKQTTYDLFSVNTENAVAEKFHAKEEISIADKIQKSHISNIREAIGINEKFLFINELFNGDLGRYNKILDDINDLKTKQGVDTYVFELKIQFQWNEDNEAFIKLKELLNRKFI